MKQLKIYYLEILRITFCLWKKKEKNCYKPVRVNNFWSNNYIEYKSNSNENRILSVEEYHDKIRWYTRDIINDLKQCDA